MTTITQNSQAQALVKIFKENQPSALRPALDTIIAELAKPGSADHAMLAKAVGAFGGQVTEIELKMLDNVLDSVADGVGGQPVAATVTQQPAKPTSLDGPFGVEANSPAAKRARRAAGGAMRRAFNNVIVDSGMIKAAIMSVPHFAQQSAFAEIVAGAHMTHHDRLGGEATLAAGMVATSVVNAHKAGDLASKTVEDRAASVDRIVASMLKYPELGAYAEHHRELAAHLLDKAADGSDAVDFAIAFLAYGGVDPSQAQDAVDAILGKIFPEGQQYYGYIAPPTFTDVGTVTPQAAAEFIEYTMAVPHMGETDDGKPAIAFDRIRSETRVPVLREIVRQAAAHCGFTKVAGLRVVMNGQTLPGTL